jgi:hypothetical protein
MLQEIMCTFCLVVQEECSPMAGQIFISLPEEVFGNIKCMFGEVKFQQL